MKMVMRVKMSIRLAFRIPGGALRSMRLRWSAVLSAISFCFSTLPGESDVGYPFPSGAGVVVDNRSVRYRGFTDDDNLVVYCDRYCKGTHFLLFAAIVELFTHLSFDLLLRYLKPPDRIAWYLLLK
jgi:hypothetical protein